MAVGAMGYCMSTVATTKGSNHPYITQTDKVTTALQICRESGVDNEEKINIFGDLILDGSRLGDAQVSCARKDFIIYDSNGDI